MSSLAGRRKVARRSRRRRWRRSMSDRMSCLRQRPGQCQGRDRSRSSRDRTGRVRIRHLVDHPAIGLKLTKAVAHILRAPEAGPIVGRYCGRRRLLKGRKPRRISAAPSKMVPPITHQLPGDGVRPEMQAPQHAFGRDSDCLFCTNCGPYRLMSAASFRKPLQILAAGTRNPACLK